MPRVLLVRHCASTGPAADAPLTADGQTAALALADRLLVLHSIDPSFGFAGWLALGNPDVWAVEGTAGGPYALAHLWL